MAILDLAVHPGAYVTVRELSEYWGISRARVLEFLATGYFDAIELGPGIYRIRTSTALAFERQSAIGGKGEMGVKAPAEGWGGGPEADRRVARLVRPAAQGE